MNPTQARPGRRRRTPPARCPYTGLAQRGRRTEGRHSRGGGASARSSAAPPFRPAPCSAPIPILRSAPIRHRRRMRGGGVVGGENVGAEREVFHGRHVRPSEHLRESRRRVRGGRALQGPKFYCRITSAGTSHAPKDVLP